MGAQEGTGGLPASAETRSVYGKMGVCLWTSGDDISSLFVKWNQHISHGGVRADFNFLLFYFLFFSWI